MAGGLRDLKVWQEAVALGGEVVRVARQHARRETRVVTDQLLITATAIAAHISDGYGRYTASEQRQLYRAAKRDLLRLDTLLAVARHAQLIPDAAYADCTSRIQVVSRLLGGYLVYLERQLTAAEQESPAPVAR